MLSLDAQLQELTRLVGPLRRDVSAPDSWFALTRGQQPRPSAPHDRRQFPRWVLPTLAAMQCRQALPVLKRSNEWHLVYMVDISRNGVCFLHAEQLYPTEVLRLMFANQKDMCVEVMRCRVLQDPCFEVGARFLNDSTAAEEAAAATTALPQSSRRPVAVAR